MLRLFSRHGLAKSRVYIRMHEGESGIIFGCTRLDLIPNTREPRRASERSTRNRKLLIQGLNFELAARTGFSPFFFFFFFFFFSFISTKNRLWRLPGICCICFKSGFTCVYILVLIYKLHTGIGTGAFECERGRKHNVNVKRKSIGENTRHYENTTEKLRRTLGRERKSF
jgi:hypothetical protein